MNRIGKIMGVNSEGGDRVFQPAGNNFALFQRYPLLKLRYRMIKIMG